MLSALIAACSISLISLVGALFFRNDDVGDRFHRIILPGSVGIFLGVVFFELIPETLYASEVFGPIAILGGFLGFYLLSHFLDTYHHHHAHHEDRTHRSAQKLLIGDALHNAADGVVIATSFMIDPTLGILTTIGIALHEVPQEVAEYAVLRGAGYSAKKALALNFLSASTVIVGVLVTFIGGAVLGEYVFILTGIAAGNLLYIAATDLIPELRETHRNHFYSTFLATLLGVLLIGTLITATHSYGDAHPEHASEDAH